MKSAILARILNDGITFDNIRCPFCGYRHPIDSHESNLMDWYDGNNYEYICKITNIEFVFAYDEVKKGIYVSAEDMNTKTVIAVDFVELEKIELNEEKEEIKFEIPITTEKAKKIMDSINGKNQRESSNLLLFILKINHEWCEKLIKQMQKEKEEAEKKEREAKRNWYKEMDILIENEED